MRTGAGAAASLGGGGVAVRHAEGRHPVQGGAAQEHLRRLPVMGPGAEAVAEEFHVVVGPVVDKLMRQRPIGWYGVAGWSLYRPEALVRVETTSSIHTGV